MAPNTIEQPAWLAALADYAGRNGQAKAGRLIGYSASVVNQVLKGSYAGDVKKVQGAVEGALMGHEVDCPAYGFAISKTRCAAEQRKPAHHANPMRMQVYRACRGGCPHSSLQSTSKGGNDVA